MKRYRNEYIRILRLIESNKRLINKNENEIINLKEKKNNLTQINLNLAENQEENEENKIKLKNLREKLETLTKTEEENKKIYQNIINELNKEINNKKRKIEESKNE